MPTLRRIDSLAYRAWRCRVVNRAFGSSLTPDQAEQMIADEDITLLAALAEHDQLDDSVTFLRLLVQQPRQ